MTSNARASADRHGRGARARCEPIFDRVVCAVDGTPAGVEAARQSDALMPPGRPLELVTIVNEAELGGGWGRGYTVSPGEWQHRFEPALRALPGDRTVEMAPVFREGPPGKALVDELTRREATLAVLGSHDHRHLPGVLLDVLRGSVAAHLLHHAPCSVLVARSDHDRPRRFDTIAAGFDGSPPATAALRVAEAIASRLAAGLTVVVADGAEPPRTTTASLVEDPRSPLEALTGAPADLLVLGSRGRHGIHALGSVSERVADTCRVSILVVRDG